MTKTSVHEERERAAVRAELEAMRVIAESLEPLSMEERWRVIHALSIIFCPPKTEERPVSAFRLHPTPAAQRG